jgi:nitroreductase
MNAQNTVAVVVKNKSVRDRISQLNAAVMGRDSDPFYGAPIVIVVFADTARYTYVEDGSLAIGNMLNAAHSLGLASCWIHRAGQVFDSPEGRAMAREWGIPDSYKGIGNVILGYAEGDLPEAKPRKEGFTIIVE